MHMILLLLNPPAPSNFAAIATQQGPVRSSSASTDPIAYSRSEQPEYQCGGALEAGGRRPYPADTDPSLGLLISQREGRETATNWAERTVAPSPNPSRDAGGADPQLAGRTARVGSCPARYRRAAPRHTWPRRALTTLSISFHVFSTVRRSAVACFGGPTASWIASMNPNIPPLRAFGARPPGFRPLSAVAISLTLKIITIMCILKFLFRDQTLTCGTAQNKRSRRCGATHQLGAG